MVYSYEDLVLGVIRHLDPVEVDLAISTCEEQNKTHAEFGMKGCFLFATNRKVEAKFFN